MTNYRHPGFTAKTGAAKAADIPATLAALYPARSETPDIFYL
jgi:hypothetical protein